MKYCKRCVQPDTRPGIYFDDNGICGACLWQDEYNRKVNWKARGLQLQAIVKWAKAKNRPYDCVIGVSGGKDSVFQALHARDKLGLHCLLVNGEPENISEIGRLNIENIKQLGFDVFSIRPNPQIMKKLILKDFFRYGNPVKVTEYTLWASTYIVADAFDIPLIIQGENAGLTMGTRKGYGTDDNALNTNKQNTIAKDYLKEYKLDDITERDLFLYNYDCEKLNKKDIRGVWIQYYTKDWSTPGNAEFAIKNGLTIRPADYKPEEIGQYWRYNALDGGGLTYLNQMLKHYKLGFGATTDSACYDIREGRITRKEGIKLVQMFDGKCADKYVWEFCEYVDICEGAFWETANSFRGDMWRKESELRWNLINPIWEQCDVSDVDISTVLEFHKKL